MILGSMVPSRTVSIAFLGLLQENVSLAVIEITSYLCTFILLLHLHSSGKRNVTMLLASMLHVILTDCFVYTDMRWHAQSLVMLIPNHLPLFHVLMYSLFYYMSFVAVSRLRISIWIQPIAMGMLVLLVSFPFELLGSKYIWWTWHDTDPLLKDRWLGIPFHVMYHHFCFASGFMTIHLILKKYFLFGEYYEQEHYKREWFYVFLLAIGAQLIGFLFMALIYDLWTHFFQIEVTICFVLLMSFSIFFIWIEDREKKKHLIENLPPIDAYDSDWLYPSVDHAINQMLFVYLIFQIIMILFIDPSNLVSVGHHQPLGDCLLEEEYHSNVFLYWTKQKRNKFLCVEEFEEEFNLCNYPLTQLHYEESWYMICGQKFENYSSYLVLILASFLLLNGLFYHILKRPLQTKSISFQQTQTTNTI